MFCFLDFDCYCKRGLAVLPALFTTVTRLPYRFLIHNPIIFSFAECLTPDPQSYACIRFLLDFPISLTYMLYCKDVMYREGIRQ